MIDAVVINDKGEVKEDLTLEQQNYIFQHLVNKMYNKMRHKWAQAGYPGLRDKDVNVLRKHMSFNPEWVDKWIKEADDYARSNIK